MNGNQSQSHIRKPPRQAPPALRRRRMFVRISFAVFALLVVIRIMYIQGKAPEYDEIWTMQHYMDVPLPTVFSDVSAPNNHVLNTLGIRLFLSANLFRDEKIAMRLPALLGFCGLFLVLLQATLLLLKNNSVRGAVLAAVLLNGMVLHYAETARGYSLQSFFVFGLFFALLCFHFRPPENRTFHAVMWLLCALGACLSVSSGVLYVAILTGLWAVLYVPFRKGIGKIWREYRPLVFAGSLWILFVLAWYGGNYSRFAEGRAMFGESFHTPAQYLSYCFEVARETGLLWALPCLAVCGILLRAKPQWRICALTGGAALLMLGSALFTKGGPPRVYLPLLAPVVFGIGAAADELLAAGEKVRRIGPWLLLPVVAVCVLRSDRDRREAADPDMAVLFRAVSDRDPHVFVSYKYTDQYVVRVLFPDEAETDDQKRQIAPEMLLLLHENALSTVHVGASPDEELVPPGAVPVTVDHLVPQEKVLFWLYRLRPVRPGETLDGKAVLCFSTVQVPDETKHWLIGRFGIVNSLLRNQDSSRICYAAAGNGLDADALLELEHANPGILFFRVVSE